MDSTAGLTVADVSVQFDDVAVHGVSFHVDPGRILAIIGPSGCGKSTLLQAIAGVAPASGTIEMAGVDVSSWPPERRPSATVFQQPALFTHMSVRENIAFGLDDALVPRERSRELVDLAMVTMGVDTVAESSPSELSGGQIQRAALARALVRRPQVLLLDEPLSHVEPALKRDIRTDIVRNVHRRGVAAVYVTHDLSEAFTVGDAVGVMRSGQIEQIATPIDLYRRPASRFVADFLGQENVVPCDVTRVEHQYATLRVGSISLKVPARADTPVGPALVAVPPEAIQLDDVDDTAAIFGSVGQVIAWSFLGEKARVEIESEVGTLVVYEWDSVRPRPIGSHVTFTVKPRRGWVIPQPYSETVVSG